MGKMKENPRYNVLSFRVSDDELKEIQAAIETSKQDFLLSAAIFCARLKAAPVTVTRRTITRGGK